MEPDEVSRIREAYEQALHTLCVKDRDDPSNGNDREEDNQDRANRYPRPGATFGAGNEGTGNPVRPAPASLASRVGNRNISQPDELAQRLRGFATREACYDPSTSGRRVPYGRHYERHFPDRGRSFHPDRNDLKGARSWQRALALHELDG
jgi:hypothetical protein